MARDFNISGESLVSVKGNVNSAIAALTELGLPANPITVTPNFRHKPINVDAWGEAPADVQWMLASATIRIDLIHVDRTVLDVCVQESAGGAAAVGQMARAGTRLGGGVARFAAGWHYISLNIYAPQNNKPWNFLNAYMQGTPVSYPLGTEKSVFSTTWEAIPYSTDPWNGGNGAQGAVLWQHVLDT